MNRQARGREPEWTHDEDSKIWLRGVSWSDFERLVKMRGEHSAPRITYLDGEVELMSPSRGHENVKSVIGRLVEVWCLERGLRFRTLGAWLLQEKAKKAGVEPDECYIFGDIDRERPDLAIEIEWRGHNAAMKLAAYHRLGVREVWTWKEDALQVWVRRARGFGKVAKSQVLPELDLGELMSFVDRPTTFDAMREYRAALASRA